MAIFGASSSTPVGDMQKTLLGTLIRGEKTVKLRIHSQQNTTNEPNRIHVKMFGDEHRQMLHAKCTRML